MKKLWPLAFRNLWARKTRTLVTASGILLGVAATLAVSVMGASTTQSLKDFFAQSSGRANLTIADSGNSGEGYPQRTLRRVRSFAGVDTAAGLAVALPVSTVMVTGMAQGSGFQMSYVFPREALVTGVAIALIVSQAAALYPAWRAGRINVIEAIRSE